MINRQKQLHALAGSLLHHLQSIIQLILLAQRIADLLALGLGKCVSHTAADDQGVYLVKKVIDHIDLVRYFSSAQDGHKRTHRILHSLS